MNKIDETKPFKPVNIAVLTVSDTRTLETDKSATRDLCVLYTSGKPGCF